MNTHRSRRRPPSTPTSPTLRLFDPRQPRAPAAPDLSVHAVITAFHGQLPTLVRLGLLCQARATLEAYYTACFAGDCEGQPVARCQQHDLLRWLDKRPRWRKNATKRDALHAVLKAFDLAVKNSLIERSPYHWPEGLPTEDEPRQPLEPAEYRQLLARARPRRQHPQRRGSLALRLAVYFLWSTGARPGEMRAAAWDQVEWANGVLRQRRHKTKRKTGKDRLIPLNARLLRLLRWLQRRQPDSQFIFLNGDGEPWQAGAWVHHFRRWADRAGLPKGRVSYAARHGFCTQAIELGLGIKQVADVVGHTTTRTVERVYAAHTRQRTSYLRGVTEQLARRRHQTPATEPEQ